MTGSNGPSWSFLVSSTVAVGSAVGLYLLLTKRKKWVLEQVARAKSAAASHGIHLPQSKPLYSSTRGWSNGKGGISFEEAVLMGLAPDGGLLVPSFFPKVSKSELLSYKNMSFQELAYQIMSKFVPEDQVSAEQLKKIINSSYSTFRDSDVTPVVEASKKSGAPIILELFHGPTFAFKDVALQFLGNMFEHILSTKPEAESHITVLGATSGDTGSSAILGLRGKKGVDVFIMFPEGKVSPIQERQMTTILDKNIHNCAVEGTFDDAQAIVKALNRDPEFKEKYKLAAVNSINWCRIMAQIVYYFFAYFKVYPDVSNSGELPEISFSVPTGNFGDILAGYYAKRMGLPVKDLIVATNDNDILHQYFTKGQYHRAPKVTHTIAPSMDICVSSNFERFLYHMLNDDSKTLMEIMSVFEETGKLGSVPSLLRSCQTEMLSERVSQPQVSATIREVFEEHGYVLDPHSAIGVGAAKSLQKKDKLDPKVPVVCLACAHWGKFPDAVSEAIGPANFAKLSPPALLEQLKSLETRKTVMPATVEAVKEHMVKTLQ